MAGVCCNGNKMMFYLLAFGVIFLTAGLGFVLLQLLAVDGRRPFPAEQRLLREPGHTIRREQARLDLQLSQNLVSAVLLGLSPLMNLVWRPERAVADEEVWLRWVTLGVVTLAAGWVVHSVVAYGRRKRNLALGLVGERMVAEQLDGLKTLGCKVFHDVPGQAGHSAFNIDHVVVGRSGVFAVETKTRRLGRLRGGVMAHEVIYDGRALSYPWGEERYGLDQAGRQAEWLAAHLLTECRKTVEVRAVLALPGWSIIHKGSGLVEVVSPRELFALVAEAETRLTAGEVEQIAARLEARCRDVEM